MLRKDEITRARLHRYWPHHVALRADKVRGLDNSDAVRGFADTLSVAPLTYSLRSGDLYFVVFCFAKPADAEAFCEQFGGMPVVGLHALPPDALHEHDHMARDQRRALRRLATIPRGIVKTLMIAHGFTHELIADLALVGLVMVVIDTAKIGERTIEVELVMITDAGRRALEGVASARSSPVGQ
jgi:hypothetical protein